MSTIYKYELGMIGAEHKIQMPARASVLTVQVQTLLLPSGTRHRDAVMLWAVVNSNEAPEERTFYVVATGEPLPPGARRYIGSVQLAGGALVFHIFEAKASFIDTFVDQVLGEKQ